jgi:hypothetical protein
MLAMTLGLWQKAAPVAAAPVATTSIHQDRRPDRERSVTTSQKSSQKGFSQRLLNLDRALSAVKRLIQRLSIMTANALTSYGLIKRQFSSSSHLCKSREPRLLSPPLHVLLRTRIGLTLYMAAPQPALNGS